MQTQVLKALEEARVKAFEKYRETLEQCTKPGDEDRVIEKAYFAYLDADVKLRKAQEEAEAR